MNFAALALSLIMQVHPADLLKQKGISPKQNSIAEKGVAALPGGITIELIGACQLKAKNPKPWGTDGKPLNANQARWFWHALDMDPKDKKGMAVWADDPDSRTFAVSFRIKGDAFVNLPYEQVNSLNVLSDSSSPADAKKGFPMATQSYQFNAKGSSCSLLLEVEAKNGVDLLTIDPDSPRWPEGYSFEFKTKTTKAFRATKQKKEEFLVRRYLVFASLPESLRGVSLEMRTSDSESRNLSDKNLMVLSKSSGMPAESIDPKQQGKLAFMLDGLERPEYKRKFILSAKTSYTVRFREIPTRPK